ncbi:MAG: hypothetical protein ACHQU0_00410 [Candidatus Paceibacteria bacterium]
MPRTLPVYFYLALFCGLVALNLSIYELVFAPRVFRVSVFGAGEGASAQAGNPALLQSPGGKTLLIDTGPDASILRALGGTLPEWSRNIDEVILTSQKAAFSGGIRAIESRYRIGDRTSVGGKDIPYGTAFDFDGGAEITVISPGSFRIARGTDSFTISSTTEPRTYVFK